MLIPWVDGKVVDNLYSMFICSQTICFVFSKKERKKEKQKGKSSRNLSHFNNGSAFSSQPAYANGPDTLTLISESCCVSEWLLMVPLNLLWQWRKEYILDLNVPRWKSILPNQKINFNEFYGVQNVLKSHKILSRLQNHSQHCVTSLLTGWKDREHIEFAAIKIFL